jgi:uncharacterized protein YgbK (DUF1537 family)
VSSTFDNPRSATLNERLVELPLCVLVADDLTGACDSGLEFAHHGLVTRVAFGKAPPTAADVVVISTNSRRLGPQAAAASVHAASANLLTQKNGIVFKKIDSTLRGNIIAECDALRESMGLSFGVIAPALPTQGRIVERGALKVQDISGSWSIDAREHLARQGVTPTLAAPRARITPNEFAAEIEALAAGGSKYVLCDAANERELQLIAAALMVCPSRPMWIGSAGLAGCAAAALAARRAPRKSVRAIPPGPVILCIGSDHPATNVQVAHFRGRRACRVLEASAASAATISSALASDSQLILMIDTAAPDTARLNELFAAARAANVAAVLLTGGDTAELICRSVHAEQLLLEGELLSGVAYGHIEGGLLDGVAIATKSGGFGAEDCLLESVDRLLGAHTPGGNS